MPLYAHEPQSLLALLEPLLPYSLSIVGTIHTTLSTGKPLQQVYTSFPDITSPPEQWLAVVALPPPAVQIRLFHTLEAESDPDAQAINAAAELVAAAVTEIKLLHPQNYKTGAIHLLWCPAVRAVVGGPDGSPTMTYLAPNELPSPPAADTRGLVLDHGREGDEHLVSESSDPPDMSDDRYTPRTSTVRLNTMPLEHKKRPPIGQKRALLLRGSLPIWMVLWARCTPSPSTDVVVSPAPSLLSICAGIREVSGDTAISK